MPVPHFDVTERRRRLVARHHLGRTAADEVEAASALGGLHSSDPASPFLSAWVRTPGATVAGLEAALYDQRRLVRMLGMRRTVFVVTPDQADVMAAACARRYVPTERRRLVGMVEGQGLAPSGRGDRWVDDVADRTCAALADLGEATAVELTKAVPELGLKLHVGAGKKWEGTMGISTRILFLVATEGRVVRGRPRGSWLSSQYRWALTDTWLGRPLADLDEAGARVTIAAAWLAVFGPATEADLTWWTGWTKTATRAALAAIDAVPCTVETGPAPGGEVAPGWVLAGDAEPVEPGEVASDTVALLPALDPTTMGWKERAWYVGDHGADLFDRNGNAGPTVWVGGRIVGAWAQRGDASVVVELLDDVDPLTRDAVDAEADRLTTWFDGTVATVRFPAPLQQRLARS